MLLVVNELKISCRDDEMEGSIIYSTIIVTHVGLVHACAYLNTHKVYNCTCEGDELLHHKFTTRRGMSAMHSPSSHADPCKVKKEAWVHSRPWRVT